MNGERAVAWVDGAPGERTEAFADAESRFQRRDFTVERIAFGDLADDVAAGRPDCLVVDADSCPDPVAAIQTIRETDPAVAVVALAREGDESLAHRAVAAGAAEYVPSIADEALVDAVERAIDRGSGRASGTASPRPTRSASSRASSVTTCEIRSTRSGTASRWPAGRATTVTSTTPSRRSTGRTNC
ncbi:hypothetical protein ACFQL4_14315 [Halosimplex aquaticum]